MTATLPESAAVAPRFLAAGPVHLFPPNAGATVLLEGRQIAVFRFERLGRWFACQNLCPHKLENVLGRGLLGELDGEPKVACPLHKRTFSLLTGDNLNGDCPPVELFPVRVIGGVVEVGLPAADAPPRVVRAPRASTAGA